MAGTLIGEIVNSCDATTGFSAGNISGDDDFAEGTGALGAKVSNTYTEFYTTTLGASAPYDFSVGGNEEGYHFIMWFSSKSKLNATAGYRLIYGNGTSRGEHYVPPVTSELKRNGAFVTRVVDPARDFDRISAGSWTLTGNPAQLTSVTQMGGGLQTTVSIMGSFNNAQVDQMVIGLGIRLSGGTSGTPDTFEVARAADEDTAIWGWSQADILKGGIYIGPATGSAASVFTSVRETRKFASAPVATGFYRLEARGAGTDVTITGLTLTAEDSSVARWDYTVGSDTQSWDDESSVYSGIDVMTLESFASLKNLVITDVNSIIQNGALIDGVVFSEANTADGVALITSDNPANIERCEFNFSDGHAIELTATGTYTFDGNTFTGYGADGTNDAAIYNNSGGAVTINITGGGDTPTIRNGTGASTTINNSRTLTLTGILENSEVTIVRDSDSAELFHVENVSVSGQVQYTYDAADASTATTVLVFHVTDAEPIDFELSLPSSDTSIPVPHSDERNFSNP